MGATIARGVIQFVLGLAIATLILVLAVAYLPGFESFFTGMYNQIIDWAHQIHNGEPDVPGVR